MKNTDRPDPLVRALHDCTSASLVESRHLAAAIRDEIAEQIAAAKPARKVTDEMRVQVMVEACLARGGGRVHDVMHAALDALRRLEAGQ